MLSNYCVPYSGLSPDWKKVQIYCFFRVLKSWSIPTALTTFSKKVRFGPCTRIIQNCWIQNQLDQKGMHYTQDSDSSHTETKNFGFPDLNVYFSHFLQQAGVQKQGITILKLIAFCLSVILASFPLSRLLLTFIYDSHLYVGTIVKGCTITPPSQWVSDFFWTHIWSLLIVQILLMACFSMEVSMKHFLCYV